MQNYRYGKFCFWDYWTSWVGLVVLTLFAIASIILDLSVIFVMFPLVYAAVWLWSILLPHREQFTVDSDAITVFRGNKTLKIVLPTELILIISCADIAPLFATRTATRGQTHILKDKYAVSILQKMPTETVLESLHRNYLRTYTMSTILNSFDSSHFIYSFVCDQSLLNQILANRKCLMIIPKSLLEETYVNTSAVDVYVDICC